jgi:hypothetical protein
MTTTVSIAGMVAFMVSGAVCALGAGCAFDASGAQGAAGDDDSPGVPDAAVIESHPDAMPPPPPLPDAGPTLPPPDPRGELHCPRVMTMPVLDGHLEDWPLVAETKGFEMGQAAQVLDESAFYTASMSASVRCLHDDQRIYFGVVVHDDHRVVDSTLLYDDDAVHFDLDARADAAGPYGTDDHEIVLRADGMYHDYAQGAAAVQLEGVVVTNGQSADFTVEIALPKTSLGATPPLPARLGFDVALTDDDGFGAYAYGLWFLSQRPVCATCCVNQGGARAWCDTTTFGGLVLE